jgi:hypothetical protein
VVHAKVEIAITQIRRGVANLVPEDLLWDKKLGDVDARAIAAELRVNTALTRLDLFTNSIGPAGTALLAGVLGVNTALTVLNLDDKYIGTAGGGVNGGRESCV